MTWIPLVTFLLHVAEEYRGFPAWATRHFGVTSRAWYVYSHIDWRLRRGAPST